MCDEIAQKLKRPQLWVEGIPKIYERLARSLSLINVFWKSKCCLIGGACIGQFGEIDATSVAQHIANDFRYVEAIVGKYRKFNAGLLQLSLHFGRPQSSILIWIKNVF